MEAKAVGAVAAGIYDFRRLPRVINVLAVKFHDLDVLGGTAASHYGGRRLQDSRRRRALGALRSGCLLPGPIGQHLRATFSRGQELNEIQPIMKTTLGGFGQRLIVY